MNANTQPKLYPVSVWEKAKPAKLEFDHVFFTKDRKVRLVHGIIHRCIPIVSYIGTEGYSHKYIPVRWDGFGRCWLGKTSRKHMRDFDIDLKNH